MPLPLPDELIEIIIQYLSKQELSRFSRVNRRFCHIALPVLYHTISGLPDTRLIHLLFCLCTNPIGPRLVRELKIDWRRASLKQNMLYMFLRGHFWSWTSLTKLTDRMGLLNAALRRLSNLTTLVIMVNMRDKDEKNAARIFKKVEFSQSLTSLSTSLTCERTLMTFLRHHPRINDLNLCFGCRADVLRDFPLSSHHLPLLSAFGWSQGMPSEHVQHIIEGRPIEKINITLNSEAVPKMITLLGHMARRIIWLFLKLRTRLRRDTLSLIAARFPRLRKLKISLHYLPTLEMMPIIAASLARFQRLRVLTIMVKHLGYDDLQVFLVPYAQQWFVLCPTLAFIELPQIGQRLDRAPNSPGALIIRDMPR
ncbi:hypothetical protein AX16_009883 [Volvariella volvacea WC 439]|nr:hypothetical protein AX16_009883 [Volvariella volvacea WC 439]